MSKAFIKFADECGIHRRHSTRNRQQQNGVAERANRTMAEDISAMLFEAKLPPSLWGEALTAQIHVWNCLPTSTLKGMTPHEAWFKRKPDVSHLRVWGCLAYVFIQKDKRRSLQPHMEQCLFVGYPSGYKGWKFYNPSTKKYIISEQAEFDERIFPGLAKYTATSPVDLTSPKTVPLLPDTTPDLLLNLEGDGDVDVEGALMGNRSGCFLDTDSVAPMFPYLSIPRIPYVILLPGSFCLFLVCSSSCI